MCKSLFIKTVLVFNIIFFVKGREGKLERAVGDLGKRKMPFENALIFQGMEFS